MSTAPVTLANCEQEPIRVPGNIQPHGVLLVLDSVGRVVQASANVEQLMGVPLDHVLGQDLANVISEREADELLYRIDRGPLHARPIYLQPVRGMKVETAFDAIAHRLSDSDNRVVLELEPADHSSGPRGLDLYRQVQDALAATQNTADIDGLCHVAAKYVRQLNGFDRVMVYRFDAQWNGQVVGEVKRADIEPFHGLNYPASDIPAQARELYTHNWLRFIADRDYIPSPIEPAHTRMPLDMSQCVLRSVSPIHLQYLRNMGVAASMSISLLRQGKLWGLIACHHYSPRRVPFEVRTACELLGQMLSLQLETRETAAREAELADRKQQIKSIVAGMSTGQGFSESLTSLTGGLLKLMDAGGAAVVVGEDISRVGQTPGDDVILDIVGRLHATEGCDVQGEEEMGCTDQLGKLLGSARLDPLASGALMMSFSRLGNRAIIWFRPEKIRTVDWAGDPAKSITKGEEGVRLSPRGSFALWKETVRGRSVGWSAEDLLTAAELRREILTKLLETAADLARSNEDLRRQQLEREVQLERERAARTEAERTSRAKDDFVATLSHELRTPLNAIQGWTQLLRSGKRTQEEVDEALLVIERNVRMQSQLVEDLLDMSRIMSGKMRLDVQPVNFPMVIESAIDTVRIAADAKGIRIHRFIDPMNSATITGDPSRLQQVIWNLLTNAVKFTPKGGRIRVELQLINSHVELSINDNGAGLAPEFLPHVFDRFRQADATSARTHGGLGLGLSIVRHLVEMHGGIVSAESSGLGNGSTFTVSLPMRALSPKDRSDNHPRTSRALTVDCDALHIGGIRALVVDDEPDSRELIKRLLAECDLVVTAVGSAADARAAFAANAFDVIVSDVGMPGEDGYSMIRSLRDLESKEGREKTPAVALTAYARPEDRRKSMLAGFQVHVSKPVEAAELLAVIASLTGRV